MVGGRAAAQRPLTVRPGATSSLGPSAPDRGLYGPGSEAWRLNREAALLLGAGPRALLLQLAHPLVAEGVDQHSDFRADPWSRLAGTLRSYLRIVYGTTPQARGEIARLNRLHGPVSGPVRDAEAGARLGMTSYRARDPELSLWVHATLVESTMAVVDAWHEPLAHARRATFYAETLPVGRLFGVPEAVLPPDVEAFDEWFAGMLAPGGPVHPSRTARELAQTILHPPLAPAVSRGPVAARLGPAAAPLAAALDLLPRNAATWLLLPAIGLLPSAVRDGYGFAWGPAERATAAWLTAGWRLARPVFPPGVRWFPQALAASRRTGGS
jgi:uncharacterized protein (DUF2236 family)